MYTSSTATAPWVPLAIISSMATRQLLSDLTAAYTNRAGDSVNITSVGGVDAVHRVKAGEAFDVVVLATDAIDQLIGAGLLRGNSKVDLVHSGIAAAVRAGSPPPHIADEDAVRQAVLGASTLGYSTGPSGVALVELFDRWGISDQIRNRVVIAPPGVSVGGLVASGAVALGFQQLSELMHLDGITVVGTLPEAVAITTVFSAATCATSAQSETTAKLFAFMAAAESDPVKQKHGMQAA